MPFLVLVAELIVLGLIHSYESEGELHPGLLAS
jgi:hypothetical protein